MKTKQALSIVFILLWQVEVLANAGLVCSQIFSDSSTLTTYPAPQKPTINELNNFKKQMAEIEVLEIKLAEKTKSLLSNAVYENSNQIARELEMAIKYNLWGKASSSVQNLRIKMQEAYSEYKFYEPRILELRESARSGKMSKTEVADLAELEAQRKAHQGYIGINLPTYKRVMHVLQREIAEGKVAEKQLSQQLLKELTSTSAHLKSVDMQVASATDAAPTPAPVVLNAGSIQSAQSQVMQGTLAKHVLDNTKISIKYGSLDIAKHILDPTIKQLDDIATGKDKNLAENEKTEPRKAKAKAELALQVAAEKEYKNIERLISSEANFTWALEKAIKLTPGNWAKTLGGTILEFRNASSRTNSASDVSTPTLNLEEVRNSLRDVKSLLAHYSGISKLMDVYLTPQQRYNLFKELCAHFNPPIDGMSPFLITLVRRSDAFDLVNELSAYIKEHHPNEIMGKNVTMSDLIAKAESYRELGLLPSIFDPKSVVKGQLKKALYSGGMAVLLAVTYAVISQYFTPGDDDKNKAPQQTGP